MPGLQKWLSHLIIPNYPLGKRSRNKTTLDGYKLLTNKHLPNSDILKLVPKKMSLCQQAILAL